MIFAAMRDAFEQAGVWRVHVERHRGRSVHAQWRSAEHRLRLSAGGVSSTCSTQFHWRRWWIRRKCWHSAIRIFATAWRRRENATPNLYAVVEDGLDGKDPAIGFALSTLDRYGIDVATVSQMPAIAERAREELRL